MIRTLCQAIKKRRILEFNYDGLSRVVEPHLVGDRTTGRTSLSSFQVGGKSHSGGLPDWRPFTVAKISGLEVTGRTFDGPRPGYNPDDSRMTVIHCRL